MDIERVKVYPFTDCLVNFASNLEYESANQGDQGISF